MAKIERVRGRELKNDKRKGHRIGPLGISRPQGENAIYLNVKGSN